MKLLARWQLTVICGEWTVYFVCEEKGRSDIAWVLGGHMWWRVKLNRSSLHILARMRAANIVVWHSFMMIKGMLLPWDNFGSFQASWGQRIPRKGLRGENTPVCNWILRTYCCTSHFTVNAHVWVFSTEDNNSGQILCQGFQHGHLQTNFQMGHTILTKLVPSR